MPSRRPRSATTTCGAGHSRWIAANTAQPGSTNSARSGPTQGCCSSPAGPGRAAAPARHRLPARSTPPRPPRRAIARQVERDPASVVAVPRCPAASPRPAASPGAMRCTASNGAQLPFHLVHHRRESGGVTPASAVALGQRNHAQRQRARGRSAAACRPAQPHPGQFGGAAADIEQQRPPAAAMQQRCAAFQRQLGFLARRDGLEGRPVSASRAARNSAPLAARRQASVATARSLLTGRRASRCRAAHQRGDRAIHGRVRTAGRYCAAPRPGARCGRNCPARETPRLQGVPTSSRQLLVPRSMRRKGRRPGASRIRQGVVRVKHGDSWRSERIIRAASPRRKPPPHAPAALARAGPDCAQS